MKKLIFFIFSLLMLSSHYSQAQYYALKWTNTIGGKGWDMVTSAVSDTNYYIYLVGSTYNKAGTVGLFTNDQKKRQAFINKTDTTGSTLWVKPIGENSNCEIHDVQLTHNVLFISGSFTDTLSIEGISVYSPAISGLFLAAFTLDGNILWLKSFGADNFKVRTSKLCTSPDGNAIFLLATFTGNFLNESREKFTGDQPEAIVIKLDWQGGYNSSLVFHSDKEINCKAIIWNQNRIYLAGSFKGEISFGDKLIPSSGGSDAYIAVLSDSLEPLNISTYGSFMDDEVSSLISNGDNEIFASGSFMESIWLNPVILSARGCKDIFLLKSDTSLSIQWASQIGGRGIERVFSLGIGNNGDILVSGSHTQDCIFGELTTTKDIPKSTSGFNNAFLAVYNSDGEYLTSMHFPGTSETTCKSMLTDKKDNLYCIGNFTDQISVPSADKKLSLSKYQAKGDQDIFISCYGYKCDEIDLNLTNDSVLCQHSSLTLDAGPDYTSYHWLPSGSRGRFEYINTPGWYSVAVKDVFGCIAKDSIQVILSGIPLIFAGKDTTIHRGSTYQCKSAYTKNASEVYWTTLGSGYFEDPLNLNTKYIPSMSDFLGEQLILELHGSNQCGGSVDIVSLKFDEEGIVSAQPNPSTGLISLSATQPMYTFEFIEILSNEGTLLSRFTPYKIAPLSVDLTQYPPGQYLIRYGNSDNSGMFRITKL